MSALKSLNDTFVTLTGESNNLNGVANAALGFSSFFKELPKFLQMLPERFHEYVPSFFMKELPDIWKSKVDILFSPIKDFLVFFDFASTIKTVTDDGFEEKKWHQQGNSIAKLVSGGIEAIVLIPEKLQWFSAAGFFSSEIGSFTPFLHTATDFLNSFTIVGKVAGAAASVFSIITNAQDIQNANKKIEDYQGRITKLTDLSDAVVKEDARKIDAIVQDSFFKKDRTDELAKAYNDYFETDEKIKELETSLEDCRWTENVKAIADTQKELNEAYAKLEDAKEHISRLHYFWNQYQPDLIKIAKQKFSRFEAQAVIKQIVKDQKEIAKKLADDQALKDKFGEEYAVERQKLKDALLTEIPRQLLEAFGEQNDIDAFAKQVQDANINDFNIIQSYFVKTNLTNYVSKIDKLAPPIGNKYDLRKKVVQHVINYEIDQSKMDIRTLGSQKTRSWIIIAMEVTKIVLTAFVLIKPIVALAAVALGASVLAGISAAVFGVGIVLTIVGLARTIYGLYWLDPKKQPQAHSHIGHMIAA